MTEYMIDIPSCMVKFQHQVRKRALLPRYSALSEQNFICACIQNTPKTAAKRNTDNLEQQASKLGSVRQRLQRFIDILSF